MPVRKDISAARGETIRIDIPVETGVDFWDPPCRMEMTLRQSRRGRRFASLTTEGRQLDYTITEGDSPVVSVFARSSFLEDIPALTYIYDLYAQCGSEKAVVARGFFSFEENSNHASDLPAVTAIPCESTAKGLDPVIVSTNDRLRIKCNRPEPLYFEVHAPRGLRRAFVETDFGHTSIEVYWEGKWVKDPSFAVGADRYRVVFTRFPPFKSGTPAWKKDQWKGGSEDLPCDTDCDDFCLTVVGIDSTGVETRERFCVGVGENAPESAEYDPTPRGEIVASGWMGQTSSADLKSAVFAAQGCSVFPGGVFVLGAL